MIRRITLFLSVVFLFASLGFSQGYVYQNTSRPDIDSNANFFELDLEFEPDVVEEGDMIVLTARDLGSGDAVEGVELYFEDEYLGETDSTGSYRFSIGEAGSYEFRGEIADYKEEEELDVLAPVSERYNVESQGMVSGDFLAYTSGLDYLMFLLIFLAFFAGYLQHSGRFTVFKIVE